MKIKVLSFVSLMLITLVMMSCKKEDIKPSNPELIKSKVWVSTQIAVRVIGLESDPYAFTDLKIDFKDDTHADVYYQNKLKSSTTYSFYSDNTKLKFDNLTALSVANYEFNFTELTVKTLTNDELVIIGSLQDSSGLKKEFILYFKH